MKNSRYHKRVTNNILVWYCILKMYYRVGPACDKSLFILFNSCSLHVNKYLKEFSKIHIHSTKQLSKILAFGQYHIFQQAMNRSNLSFLSNIFHWARMVFLICHLHKKWREKKKILIVTFINAKSLSITIIDDINWPRIRDSDYPSTN